MNNNYLSRYPGPLRRWAHHAAGILGLLLATAGAAQAQTPASFAYTGSSQTYTVPAGVTRLQVVATGASGGAGLFGRSAAGRGAQVQATVPVTPGEMLTVVVGGQGRPTSGEGRVAGGYNGGGGGENTSTGGGATDLRRAASSPTGDYLSSRNALLVAAGGGGGGLTIGTSSGGSDGGNGGTPVGSKGGDGDFSAGGGGGTQTMPGAGGSGRGRGFSGSDGNGGVGYGGSGGGGYYGGGGGGFGTSSDGGGGGGSSFVLAAGTNVSYSVASTTTNGALTLTPLYATPTLTSINPTSGPVGASVTLTGSNLGGATAVTFAGTSNNTVTTNLTVSGTGSSQTLIVNVPAGATSGNVTVTTPGGTSNGVAFTVVGPSNDDCANATQLTVAATCTPTAGTTVGATQSLPAITCAAFTGIADDDVWYKFVASAATQTVTVVGSANFDAVIDVRAGNCGSSTNIGCADATVSGGTESVTLSGLTPTSTYYVRVYGYGGAPATASTFTICVTAPSTAAPVVTSPAANSTTNGLPTFAGTAPASSTVTLYLAMGSGTAQVIGTTTATGGSFSFAPATALASGTYSVYATAQSSGATVSANSNTNTFTADATAPTVLLTSGSGGSGTGTSSSPLLFTATFSEAVTSLAASGLAVTNGTVSSGPTAGSSTTYTFQVTPTTPGTATTVQVRAGAVTDLAGNGNSASAIYTLTYSQPVTAAPVVTAPTNGSTTNGSPVASFTVPANSAVTVYLNGQDAQYLAGSSSTLSIGYSNLASGTYTLYATAQVSGQAVSARSNVVTFTVDNTPPTATLSTTAGSATSTSPIPFTIAFSEAVTGLSASSFTVSNGTVTSGSLAGNGTSFGFSVTPTGNGPVSVSLPANAVRDGVGNGNLASNTLSAQYTAPVAANLSVLYQTGDFGQPTDGQVRPFFQLVNSGASAVPYSQLTVRYWLTVETFKGQLVTPIDWAKLGTSFVSARYVQLAAPRQGAFGYIEYSFAAGAGSLNPGSDSGPIYGKAYKPDYTSLDETDDWSYQTSSAFTANSHVTLYQNGTLLAGTEPAAVTATTALQVLAASRDNAASTQFISVQLQVRNTGNLPVSYGDVRARYYFTRDGASTVVAELDYAKLGNNNVSLRVVNLPAAVSGADAYVEVTFSAALGVFYPRTSTDDILFKLRKDTYQAFDQTNDYSFTGSTALALNPRFTAYVGNQLVFGTPPSSNSATRSAASSAPASASGATIVAAASGPLALTASPNPFGEQLTLRFALPTAQAYTLAVYDGQGRLVQQLASGQAEAEQAQEVAVPTQGYAAGLYLVRLTTAEGVQTLKLVKR